MVGWHRWLNGHEFEQTPGDGEGQGSLVCCSPQGHKESDLTDLLNSNSLGAHHLSTFVTRISLRDIASSCQGIQSTENEKKKIEGKKIHSRASWWLSGKECTCQCRRHEFDSWSGKIPHAAGQLSQCTTRACALEPGSHNYRSPRTLEPQQKPSQQWAHISQLESRSNLPQLEKSLLSSEDPAQ